MQTISKARHGKATKAFFTRYSPARGTLPHMRMLFLIWRSDQAPNVFYDLASHSAAIIKYFQA